MRRAVARGRVFPQSFSTDRRYGRLSLKACALFPLMWANADDQGRLCGDPEEIKYAVCPNIDHIAKSDVSELLDELHRNQLIELYNTPHSAAIQILDWWEVQRLQWAWPSDYPSPEGWHDRLRYKKSAKEVVTENWPSQASAQVNDIVPSGENSGGGSGDSLSERFLPHPLPKENEKEERRGKGRGNSPENSGEQDSSPSPVSLTNEIDILDRLTSNFKHEWGRVSAAAPHEVIPRELSAKESAQLRDLARELSSAGGCPPDYIDQAFGEAAGQSKMHVSYLRVVLLSWLGRGPP